MRFLRSMVPRLRNAVLATALIAAAACHAASPAHVSATASRTDSPPPAPPARWRDLIGEYGPDSALRIVLERDGTLVLRYGRPPAEIELAESGSDSFRERRTVGEASFVVFTRSVAGLVTGVRVHGARLARRQIGPESGNQLVITPVRPLVDVRHAALAASPPAERGPFRATDLVELVRVDSTIRLDIRYATSNNLFGVPFYTQARAFLQRPAAAALARVSATLRPMGFGLLVHDGYRPWSVTKMFWDAAPDDKHIFVADPAEGSKHNRGAAVDLTLYDRATGAPVEMVSTYDETTDRAAASYPGGTSRQRWHRDLLRRTMEAEGFSVVQSEWWHFDYADWKEYGIGNAPFESIR